MTRDHDHDRFEALAGAVMLGEATAEERALFDAHAAHCDACRLDAACAPILVGAVSRARDAETWRPSIGGSVLGRIRDSRRSRFRVTVGALGWAVALSIAINVVVASGLSARFARLSVPDAGGVAATTIELESPAPRRAPPRVVERHALVAAVVPAHRTRRARTAVSAARPVARATSLPDATTDVPDVLAGLDIDGADGSKHVAVEVRPTCAPVTDRDVAVETPACQKELRR